MSYAQFPAGRCSWCDSSCVDNSKSPLADRATGYARYGNSFRAPGGLTEPSPKLRDRQLRAVRPVMRDTPANCARPNMRDVPIPGMTARGLPRPFMRMLNSLSVLASRGGRAGATSYARSTRWSRPVPHPPITPLAATGYACTTMRSDQRKHLPRPSMRGQHAGRHADVPWSACPAQ